MASRSTGPQLSDDPRLHEKEEHFDSYFGPALRTTDRPDYFTIRSKLAPALVAIIMIVSLFLTISMSQSTFGTASLIVFLLLLFVLLRIYMGIAFDFFPDGVHSFIPDLLIYHSFYFIFDFLENKKGHPEQPGFRLRNIERTRLSAVQMHKLFGRAFILISLDDVRIWRIWWLSAIFHPRRIITLMLNENDGGRALPMIRAYLYRKGA